jgi:hypothetical protein
MYQDGTTPIDDHNTITRSLMYVLTAGDLLIPYNTVAGSLYRQLWTVLPL